MPTTDFFSLTLVEGRQYQQCRLCSSKYAWAVGRGYGSLKRHIQAHHPFAIPPTPAAAASTSSTASHDVDEASDIASIASPAPAKRSAPPSSASSSSSATVLSAAKRHKTGNQTRLELFAPSTAESIAGLAAIAFATNRLPFQLADRGSFRAFLDAIRQSPLVALPSAKVVHAATTTTADEMRKTLIKRLKNSSSPIGVALDGWTDVRGTKVTNIVLICDGVAYYWCSITNPLDKNTAAWLHTAIEPRLVALAEADVKFVSFIADNEAVMGALFNKLKDRFPFLIRVPCAAHTVQLIVKSCFQAPRWKKVREEIEEIVKGFCSSKEKRIALQSAQQTQPKQYALIKPNDTRWNSFLYASERLVKLKRFVNCVFEKDDEFWKEVEQLVAFLQPFQKATDELQKDAATLFDVWQQWNVLSKHVGAMVDALTKKDAMTALRWRWNEHVNIEATVAVAVLSFGSLDGISPEQQEEAGRFIVSFGVEYLCFFKLSTSSREKLKGDLLVQLAQFLGRQQRFSGLEETITLTQTSSGAEWSATLVWAVYRMELSLVARALLTIPASEAAVERTFSAQDGIHTKKRNRLADSKVEESMFVSFNHAALNASSSRQQVRPATIELALDFMDTDTEESEDEDEEEEEEKKQHLSDVEIETEDSEKLEPAVVARTFSEITADTLYFLKGFINEHKIVRWTAGYEIMLDAAALNHNTGGGTTRDLIKQIKSILAQPAPAL